ncbi:peptide deformylase [Corynebacterium lipophiloflavum]|uniref:Peptide deformylase n=1 Tax=Corynebacterium lipophiloflavum (strain ATCC 700352 / DSM 44291 / CCUG 37336 / JCM 10383 / DMMZ 1944) TaxID=525263 RepID=C0XSV2_CORLD|nr:peptide deformylase [Corynebacterium lipophiloflavum]EEI16626.1 peptide deformylase [Corynebacterium lipophiloflavum DSM 44291]
MAVRPIRLFGDPVLNSAVAPVTRFDEALRVLVCDLLNTMDDAGGVGLAANQVGVDARVFVFDCQGMRGHIINPSWASAGDEVQIGREGCLSVPGISGPVSRYNRVVARGVDADGRPLAISGTGLLARCIQHESDHLDGIMFMRRMDSAARKEAMTIIRGADWFQQP